MGKGARFDSPGVTVSADLIQGLIDCAVLCRVPRVSPSKTSNAGRPPPERFSVHHLRELWARLVRLSQDPIIGYRMALVATPKTFGLLGRVVPYCATLLDAFRCIERYAAIASQGGRIFVTCDASHLTMSVASDLPKDAVVGCNVMMWLLTNLSLLPQRLIGPDAPRPIVVECAFPSPGDAAMKTLREKVPFKFGMTHNRVIFHAHVGNARIPAPDEVMRDLVSQAIEQQLKELGPSGDFEHGMATILRGMINGTLPTLQSLSAHVGVSPRTLQRRLAESNTSFQQLQRKVLHEAADELMSRGATTQAEVAFLLGYSDVSAFSHAYRSWTGHPPGGSIPSRPSKASLRA